MSERIRPIFATTEAKFQNAQDELINLFGPVPINGKDHWFQANKEKIRNIINSGFSLSEGDVRTREEWLTEVLFSYHNFLTLEFGSYSGADVLNALGVVNKEEFYELVDEIFPEQGGTLLLLDVENAQDMRYRDSRAQLIKSHMRPAAVVDDINQLITEMGESPDSQGAIQRLAALINSQEEPYSTVQTDSIILKKIKNAWSQLSEQEQRIITERIFNEKTLQEVAETIGRSKERVSQIFDATLIKLRKFSSSEIKSTPFMVVEKNSSEPEKNLGGDKRKKRLKAVAKIKYYLAESLNISLEEIKNLSLGYAFFSFSSPTFEDSIRRICQQKAVNLFDSLSVDDVKLVRKFFNKRDKENLSRGEKDESEDPGQKYVKDILRKAIQGVKKELLREIKSQFNPIRPEDWMLKENKLNSKESKLKASSLRLELIGEMQSCVNLINLVENDVVGGKEKLEDLIYKLLPAAEKIKNLRAEYFRLFRV